jgi:hypothetical protein
VGFPCGPWLRVAEGVPDVVGAAGAQTEIANPISVHGRDSVFPDSSVEPTLWALVFRYLYLPTGIPKPSLERDRIVEFMKHLYVAVFLVVTPCERCGGFVVPLHIYVQEREVLNPVGSAPHRRVYLYLKVTLQRVK